ERDGWCGAPGKKRSVGGPDPSHPPEPVRNNCPSPTVAERSPTTAIWSIVLGLLRSRPPSVTQSWPFCDANQANGKPAAPVSEGKTVVEVPMFFSQTVRRDDEGAERGVIARALGGGRDSFDQRRMPTEGSEDDDPLRWLGPGESHRSSNFQSDQFASERPSIGRGKSPPPPRAARLSTVSAREGICSVV